MSPEIDLQMSEIKFVQEKERKLNNNRSEEYIVAQTIWAKGAIVLVSITEKYKRQGLNISGTTNIYSQIPQEDRRAYMLAKNCVVFGISSTALDTAIREGKVADEDIVIPYNNTVDNTYEPRIEGHLSHYFTEKQAKKLRKTARKAMDKGKTMSFFYTDGFKEMPDPIAIFLSIYGNFSVINESILPYFIRGVAELKIDNAKAKGLDTQKRE
ncbi:MAG: hypothetical protein AAB531_03780 [Patescibacteria group bacterium]